MSETEGQDVPDTARRSYESATERLDQIISRLDSGDAQLRETLDLCAEAKELIEESWRLRAPAALVKRSRKKK